MKHIGILTWYFGINYGARAHSLALKEVIESLGYECEFINFASSNNLKLEIQTCCMSGNLKRHPVVLLKGIKKWTRFKKQLSYYPTSRKVSSAQEIETLGYDAVIIGSDEVLNLNHSLTNMIYYGVGFSDSFPMAMYAVSAGTVSPDTVLSEKIHKGLLNVRFISVRDNTTQELLSANTGRSVKIVLDPTLLYDFPKCKARRIKENYLLIYSFGSLSDEKMRVIDFAKNNNVKIVCVGRECDWADKSYPYADLNDWLSLYENASYVVTDSYHGLIFAIKYQKNFILVARDDKTNKIDGLRNILNINRGYLKANEEIDDYLRERVNYQLINSAIDKGKNLSIDFLRSSLEALTEQGRK